MSAICSGVADDDAVAARPCQSVQQLAKRRALALDDAGDDLAAAAQVVGDAARTGERLERHRVVERVAR